MLVNGAGANVILGAGPEAGDGLAGVAWQWLENLRANTLTAALLTEALKPHLTSPGGRVVLICSIAAYRGSGSGSYGGSKAALHPYAYDLADELGRRGVTVNVVAPGYVEDTEFFRGQLPAERRRTLVDQTPHRPPWSADRRGRDDPLARLAVRRSRHRSDHPGQRRRGR